MASRSTDNTSGGCGGRVERYGPITVRPIGLVVRGEVPPPVVGGARRVYEYDEMLRREEVLVYIYPEYRPALRGLEVGQLVWIIWYAHLSPSPPPSLLVHPYGDPRLPVTGVFATRSPVRPNNIMLSLARITRLEDCGFRVVGLDALGGSPVLDVKPYSRGLDSPEMLPQGW